MIGAPIVGPDVRAWAHEIVRYMGRAVVNLQYLTPGSSATVDGILMWDPVAGGVVVSDSGAWVAVGGGAGATDLAYTAATRLLASSTGTDVTLPLVASDAGLMSAADKTKLDGVATGATANSADAVLLARANHTGTQVAATISDFSEAVDDRVAGLLVAGSNITLTYDDPANTLTIAATGGGSSAPVSGRIYRTTNQSIPGAGVFANLVWSASAYQIGGVFWTSGATVTISETGLTRVNVEATFDGTGLLTIATSNMELVLNGLTIIGEDEVMVAIGAKGSLNVMAQRNFTAGDTLIARVKHSDTGALNILAQGDHSPDIIVTKINGARGDPGPAGLPATGGSAVLAFGADPGTNTVETVVTGQAEILAGSRVRAWFQADTTADYNSYEHGIIFPMEVGLSCGAIVPGVGFTIYASTQLRLSGNTACRWEWS